MRVTLDEKDIKALKIALVSSQIKHQMRHVTETCEGLYGATPYDIGKACNIYERIMDLDIGE